MCNSPATSQPLVSVLIVSYNRSDDLKLSLNAIATSTCKDVEVIVIDNASTDDALQIAQAFPGVTTVANASNLGFAVANNQALELARGRYIALINNDAVIVPDWLSEHVDFLESHPEAAAVGGKSFYWNEKNPVGDRRNDAVGHCVLCEDANTRPYTNGPDELREVVTLSGQAVMIRRAAINDVGTPFLDPCYFAYYEETDFFARALVRGWKLYYRGDPACWHRVRASTAARPHVYYYYMNRNRVIFTNRFLPDGPAARVADNLRTRAKRAQWNRRLLLGATFRGEQRGVIEAQAWLDEHAAEQREERLAFAKWRDEYWQRVLSIQGGFLDPSRS
jgi:GT2 family glycosyltransferase